MQEDIVKNIVFYLKENGGILALKILLGIGVFSIGYICIQRIVKKIRKRIEENSLEEDIYIKRTSNLIGKFMFILLMIFLVLAIFQVIGFDTAIIMGGVSLSIGFAMETTIGNMIAGVMIMTNQKIKLGDLVEFMGKLNMRGTIEEINVRYTVVRTYENKRVIIPNSILAKTPIKTYKSERLIRGEVFFTVPRHVHIPQVKKILIETINANAKVLYKEYTNVWIENFDTRGLQIKSVFFANPQKKSPFMIARELRPIIAENLKKYGINIPYPHITLSAEE
ncbi:MAG TPA: mechanosensitive ion channel [Candidatus Absconditabacterales bacterium]|nr:mechanosensitive ion channel [Candidatus Absconditabacterales bacterium]